MSRDRLYHTGILAHPPRRCRTCDTDAPLGTFRRLPHDGSVGEECDPCRTARLHPTESTEETQ